MASRKPAHEDGNKYDGPAEVGGGNDIPEERKTFNELARGGAAEEGHMAKDKERAKGGKVDETVDNEEGEEGSGKPTYFAGKDSYVEKAAEKKEDSMPKKKGGGVKRRARGGGLPMGKMAMKVEGKSSVARLDRKKRAAGGQVGADTRPLTSAHALTAPKGDKRTSDDD